MLEAYKFAFRDYSTWNRAINYYRFLSRSFSQKSMWILCLISETIPARCAASKGSRQWVDQVAGKRLQMIQVLFIIIQPEYFIKIFRKRTK